MSEERVQKILAQAGFGSRRSCEELIVQGRVSVNGQKVILGQKADISLDKILVDGKPLPQLKENRYVLLYKPRFVLCDKAADDPRRTVFGLVENGDELAVVGRLDYESEGLVLLTNDGFLVNRLTHPRYEHEKEYRVLLSTHPDEKQLEIWRRGVVLEDGYKTKPALVRVESLSGKGAWVTVVLKEGHKRQIREMARTTGLFIVKLMRTRIGNLRLGHMKPGDFRDLTPEEVSKVLEKAPEKRTSPKRVYTKSVPAQKRKTR